MDSRLRRAALALFAMHREDREWILARLGVEVTRKIKTLIREVEQLGFRRDSVDLGELLRDDRRAVSSEVLGSLAQAVPSEVEKLLEKYGAELVLVLGDLGEFPWKEAVTQKTYGGGPSDGAVAEWVRVMPPKAFAALVAIGCDELSSTGCNTY